MTSDKPISIDANLQAAADEFDRSYGPAFLNARQDSPIDATEEPLVDSTPECPHITRFVAADNEWTTEEQQHMANCPHCQRRLRVVDRMTEPRVMLAPKPEVHRLKGRYVIPAIARGDSQTTKQDQEWQCIVKGHEVLIQQFEFDEEWQFRVLTRSEELNDSVLFIELSVDEVGAPDMRRVVELAPTADGWFFGEILASNREIEMALGQREFHVSLAAE